MLKRNFHTISKPSGKTFFGLPLDLSSSGLVVVFHTLPTGRMVAIDTFRANAEVVKGWSWISSRSAHTCHVNCRYTLVVVTKSWQEMGYAIEQAQSRQEAGKEWFDRQPDTVKKQVLGVRAFKLYQSEKVTLADFVGTKHDSLWGDAVYVRPLKEILHAERG